MAKEATTGDKKRAINIPTAPPVAEATAADGDEATGEQATFTTAPADDLSIGVSQGAARVTIAVTREGEPVENATVRVLGGGDAIAVGPYTTDADGTVVLPAPDSTVTVTIEAVENGFAGRRTVTLHAQRGHGAPFTPFGQRVSAYVDSLLTGDVPEPLGRLVAAFVTAENPGQGPAEDEPGGTEDAAEDDGHDEDDDSRGPPEHARNDDRGPPNDGDDEREEDDDSDEDEKDEEEEDDDDSDEDEKDEEEDDDSRGPPEHARNDDNPGRGN